ncbi:MFS transporter [Gallibacterium anatis]|uniref:MFS transporter n=1 Tax=Gallibacterium anatis TaxID=750 RepID=UPI00300620F1
MKKYITLFSLFIGQGFIGTVISLLTLTSILVGRNLAPSPKLASFPITMTVIGTFVMIYFAAIMMSKYGRKNAFLFSGIIGLIGSIIAIIAIYKSSFILFLFSMFLIGNTISFNQYYRFAAAEVFDDIIWKRRSTSIVIGGGVLGGILGPFLAKNGEFFIDGYPFLGNFIFLLLVFILFIFSQNFIFLKEIKKKKIEEKNNKINYDSSFLVGTLSCTVAFFLMTLIMNSAPLSMYNNHYSMENNALAIQVHFLAMYIPSFFISFILNKIKKTYIILFGIFSFLFGSILSFVFSGYMGYFFPLMFSGLGWALMFSGGTYYINEISSSKKHKLQGLNSIIIYSFNVLSSFLVGILLSYENGWINLNYITIFACILFILLLFFLKEKE